MTEQHVSLKGKLLKDLEELINEYEKGRLPLYDLAIENGDLKIVDGDLALEVSGCEDATPEILVRRIFWKTTNRAGIIDGSEAKDIFERLQPEFSKFIEVYREKPRQLGDAVIDRTLVELIR